MAFATGILFTAVAGICLLGAIVFIHELGHFLVAKACGVRILVFSLGFGPKLFGVRVGHTEYRVSILPLGGYVRMFGDDITEDIAPEDRAVSFLHKPIPMRMAIAAAGPVANFLLPIALFFVLALGVHKVAAPHVGTVLPGEPAATAGILPGDILLSVDDVAVQSFSDVQEYVEVRPRQKVQFKIRRDGVEKTLEIVPRAVAGTNPLALEAEVGRVGIVTSERLPRVHLDQYMDTVAKYLHTGDLVTAVNGVNVDTARAFRDAMLRAPADKPLSLTIAQPATTPDGAPTSRAVTLAPRTDAIPEAITMVQQGVTRDELAYGPTATAIDSTRRILLDEAAQRHRFFGLANLEGTLRRIEPGTAASAAGLSPGDRIVSIDGHPLTHAGEVASRLFERPKDVHVVGVIDGAPFAAASPLPSDDDAGAPTDTDVVATTTESAPLRIVVFRMLPSPKWGMEDFRVFGVEAATAYGPAALVDKDVGVAEAFTTALAQTGGLIRDTVVGIVKLATGQFSVRSMGGPITIFSLAGQAADRGVDDFVFLMAFISVNLGIVNLLPVPVLDGGHLLLFSIEAVRRKRMSLAAQEKLLKVGLLLLGALMALAFFNDVMRIL